MFTVNKLRLNFLETTLVLVCDEVKPMNDRSNNKLMFVGKVMKQLEISACTSLSSFCLMYFVFISYVYLYNVLHFILNKSSLLM